MGWILGVLELNSKETAGDFSWILIYYVSDSIARKYEFYHVLFLITTPTGAHLRYKRTPLDIF